MDDTSSTYQELIEENALLRQQIQELKASGPSRRQTDATLKEGEARLKETQRITKIGSWEHDLLTNKIAWSNEMYRLFEIDQERFDLSYEVIRDRVHPEDRDTFDAIYTRALTHLESTQCVHRLLMPDGRVKYIDSRSETYVNSDGKPIRLTGTVQDITERRRVEESLSKSERRFSSTFHLNPNAMAISDIITSKFIDVNEAFISQTGYSREEIIGNSTEDLQMWVNPDDRKQVIDALKETGEIKGKEVLMRAKNNNIQNVLFFARFVDIEQDHYLLTFALDITERKRAEEALRRSERKYRLLYNGMQDGFAYLNMDGTFRESNPAFEEIIGYSLEELRNLTFYDITPEKWRSTDEQALKTLSALGFSNIEEKEYRRKDGAIIPVEVRGTLLLDDQGKPSGIGAIVRDITERKQAEKALRKSEDQFRTIVNNMQDVVFRADLNGNIIFTSPSAACILGCSSTEEIIGLRIGSDFYFDPKEAQHHLEMLQRYGKLTGQEIKLKRRDNGQLVIVSANIQFFHDNAENIQGIEGVYRDITDRIQAEKERERLIQELQQAMKNVKVLSGLLPICASCKKIRDDEGYWKQIESYISAHSEAQFSHGICPDCLKKLYPDIYENMQRDGKL